jgi:hypothetical protein
VRGDARSRRVAIVPDAFVNPPPGAPDRLAELAADGWGVVALPPPGVPEPALTGWRAAVVDQITAFMDDGYEVAIAGGTDAELAALADALRAAGRPVPPRLGAA